MGRGRITIGLYNSYDQNFREPHRRVIARAGDLARAYDMGLALFGFPIPEDARTPKEIAEWVAGTTSIGGHGKNFMEMAETGRFQCFPYPGKGFPPQLGEVILTTSKPDPKKQMSLSDAVARASRCCSESARTGSRRPPHRSRSTTWTSLPAVSPSRRRRLWALCAGRSPPGWT